MNMTYDKTCRFCGNEFEARFPNQVYCKGPHYLVCKVCGHSFQVDKNLPYYESNKDSACCSKRCATIYRHMNESGEQKEISKQRRIQTMIDKYGVVNPGQMESVIRKRENTCMERYGVRHPLQSEDIKRKSQDTCIRRYGVPYSTQSDQMKKKTKETVKERYGTEYITQSGYFKDRVRKTSMERYGTEYPIQAKEVRDKIVASIRDHYGTDNPMNCDEVKKKVSETKLTRYGNSGYCNSEKSKQTCMERYGTISYSGTNEYKDKVHQTSLDKYEVDHYLSSGVVKDKRRRTVEDRYGVDNVFKSEEVKSVIRKSLIDLYGVTNPSQCPEIRKKQIASSRDSRFELRICDMLKQYNIEYERQYVLNSGDEIHAFDFYIPKYKILMDADGVYFHSYKSDPDGKHVLDCYDSRRLSIIPEDHIFILIVEGKEERAIKELKDTLQRMDEGIFDYDSELFKWCREVGFPYANYSKDRLWKDFNRLCSYENNVYHHNCRLSTSLIKQYHRSFYDCHVKNCVSVREAWDDDELLKKVITNRLIYKNDVDPNKILAGFSISKTCPTISLFNPVLAKYLVKTYLDEFDAVFDPFSGFSGRLLGTLASGKNYIGQDLNEIAVRESNQIIQFLGAADKAQIICKDILESEGTYDCLLTCPPYSDKEIYNKESEFKSCEQWIDECLNRFNCKRYVFVVDDPGRYSNEVVMNLNNKSHFSDAKECVIVIDNI